MSNVDTTATSVPAGWQEIPNPTIGSELAKTGVPYVTVGNHQYYNPTYLTHISNPTQGSQLTNQGFGAITMGNAQYYNPEQLGQTAPGAAQTPAPSGDVGIGAPGSTGMTSSQTDAWSQLQQTLQQYGFNGADLQALVQFAQQQIVAGNSQTQVLLNLEQTQQFKNRFPAIGTLAQQGVAISPAEYVSLEKQYASLEQAAGIPKNFASYDQLIANQVSPTEYADRINKGYLAVSTAPPETIKAMQDYYGVTPGQLAAYFLDPTKAEPILLQQAQAAQIGGASTASGFGQVSQAQALRLAQQGVSYSQAQQGFQQLSQESQLFGHLPGQGQRYGFTTDNLLGATFGSDGQTKLQLQIQAEQEKNLFAQGTGVAGTQQGLTGASTVQR